MVMPKTHKAGEIVEASGIYKILHAHPHVATIFAVTLHAGEEFPLCRGCGYAVSYSLVISAPQIHQDKDFNRRAVG